MRARLRAVFADTRPLRNPHFRRLWTANIVTVIGAQLTVVAVPAQIYAITRSSAMVGLAGLFSLVPLVVGRALQGFAAVAGGMASSSSNTSYIESAAGVGDGARTGFANVITGALFLVALAIGVVVMAGIVITLKSSDKHLAEVDAVATV